MKIATWNVNSLNVRLQHVLAWLDKENPDLLCLQETKLTDDKFPVKELNEIGYHSQFFGEKAYNGVAILSKTAASRVQKGFPGCQDGDAKRFIEVQVGQLTAVNVYIPNGQDVGTQKYAFKLDWMERLKQYLLSHHSAEEKLVICGDFNVALEDRDVYNPDELAGQILFSSPEKEAAEAIKQWGFVDTFRIHNSDGGLFSWWDYRLMSFRRKRGLRIDHIWATHSLAATCTHSWIDVEPRKLDKPSDHAPVVSIFDVN